MRAEGRDWKEIAEIFGLKQEKDVLARIALGNLPGIENSMLQHTVSMDLATHYLLPLRVETGRDPQNGNQRVYDYSEVTACIEKLGRGEVIIRLMTIHWVVNLTTQTTRCGYPIDTVS
ncbi:hypothetical protein [Candidatus Magnetobacterium casense]|uniref:Death domain-containing protein n=1 Tax=Candidatus Magnetobacterium casense TaxID=1455061 RepID=A0ABS6S0D7_9BACT|nr:hypothetical protein [Candidatus Magnetobacterium casensis]MBV6342314.1 hypothetical protein [Candidatus Magnetobacterium casensis]